MVVLQKKERVAQTKVYSYINICFCDLFFVFFVHLRLKHGCWSREWLYINFKHCFPVLPYPLLLDHFSIYLLVSIDIN